MHDLAPLVWFFLIVIGVASSVTSSVRKARRAAGGAPVAQPPQPPVPQAQMPPSSAIDRLAAMGFIPPTAAVPPQQRPPSPRPKPPARVSPAREAIAVPPLFRERTEAGTRPRRRLFGNRAALVNAVIASEVLGRPLALRDEYPTH